MGDPTPGDYGVTSPPRRFRRRWSSARWSSTGARGRAERRGARLRRAHRHAALGVRSGAAGYARSSQPAAGRRLAAFHPGTPNAWSVFSADAERDLLFVPLGNPTPDFYGGHRAASTTTRAPSSR